MDSSPLLYTLFRFLQPRKAATLPLLENRRHEQPWRRLLCGCHTLAACCLHCRCGVIFCRTGAQRSRKSCARSRRYSARSPCAFCRTTCICRFRTADRAGWEYPADSGSLRRWRCRARRCFRFRSCRSCRQRSCRKILLCFGEPTVRRRVYSTVAQRRGGVQEPCYER